MYPENLQELLDAGFIKKIPMDPYSDKPLIYRKTSEDFTLYSVGENFIVNGGESMFTGDGQIIKWGRAESKTGDTVFWPIP